MLSNRQLEILQLMAQGHTAMSAGKLLFLSPKTVKAHMQLTRMKLGARNTAHAVAIGLTTGVLNPSDIDRVEDAA